MALPELQPDTILRGTWRVERLLALGGMSRIYQGHPLQGAGLVAIKELCVPEDMAHPEEDLEHFKAEYTILRQVQHSGLPRALDLFEEHGRWFLVEEFVPGLSLEHILESHGCLRPCEATHWVCAVLQILEHLHQQGIIYRDLKPSNILISPDRRLRLIDFGAARRYRAGATRDTVPLGTPGFASPEHYGRGQTDARSDVYSCGALLHYLLTGQNPADHAPWQFTPPDTHVASLPPGLSDACMRAVSLDPQQRFASAAAMAKVLHPFAAGASGDPARAAASQAAPRSGPATRPLAEDPSSLHDLRSVIEHPQRRDYYRSTTTFLGATMGLLFFLATAPVWLAHVPLPHPLAGVWLAAHSLAEPRRTWQRLRSLRVEVYANGLLVHGLSPGQQPATVVFANLRHVKVSAAGLELTSVRSHLSLEGAWPGCAAVLREVLGSTSLQDVTPDWFAASGLPDRVYELPQPSRQVAPGRRAP